MIERPDAFEIGSAALLLLMLMFALAPIVERAEAVFAFFDILQRGIK